MCLMGFVNLDLHCHLCGCSGRSSVSRSVNWSMKLLFLNC